MLSQNLSRKRRGTRTEREIAKALATLTGEAFRVKGSGAIEGLPGDVMARITDRRWQIEAKRREKPPQTLLRWLGGSDALFIVPEHGEWTVTMRWPAFAELVRATQSAGDGSAGDEPPHGPPASMRRT